MELNQHILSDLIIYMKYAFSEAMFLLLGGTGVVLTRLHNA